MDIVRFESPALLYLLFLLVPMIAFYIYKFRKGKATLQISTIEGVKNTPRTVKYYLRHLPFVLRMLTVTLLIIALARPQSSQEDHIDRRGGYRHCVGYIGEYAGKGFLSRPYLCSQGCRD